MARRRILLAALLVLVGIAGVRWLTRSESSPRQSPVGSTAARAASGRTDEEASLPATGQPFVRLRTGDVILCEPQADSAALQVMAEDAAVPIHAAAPGWRQLRLPVERGRSNLGWIPTGRRSEFVVSGGPDPPRPVDAETLVLARQLMGTGLREDRCGPHPLWMEAPDPELAQLCGRLAREVPEAVSERFGVALAGQPVESILWFRELEGLRRFVLASGDGVEGYAAHAQPSKGYLVLASGPRPGPRLVKTLAHELAHLANHRAFGFGLPRWLSEGLADAVGDTASTQGIGELRGLEGCEEEAGRLREALRRGEARSLGDLLAQAAPPFDADVRLHDYEQSALVVRYLLTDSSRSEGFRGFLSELARGRHYAPELLLERLDTDEETLGVEFEEWLNERVGGGSAVRGAETEASASGQDLGGELTEGLAEEPAGAPQPGLRSAWVDNGRHSSRHDGPLFEDSLRRQIVRAATQYPS